MVALSKKEKLLASAQKLLLKGQLPKAIKEYEQVMQLEPNDLRSRLKLAELYNRGKMTGQAIEEYQKIGKYYADNGFYLKAIAVFKQAQRIDATDPQLYLKVAELNVKQGLVGNALAEYRTLVSFYEKQQNQTEAIKILQKMKDLEPENLNIRVKLAEAYAKHDRKAEALEDFQEILKVLQSKQDPQKVLKLCEIFSSFFPEERSLKIALGQALLQRGELEKGLSLLTPLEAQDPDNLVIIRTLAPAYAQTGKYRKAQELYTRLLQSSPGDLDLREEQIQAFLDGADYAAALKTLEQTKAVFLEFNRIPRLREFYACLQEHLPDEERVAATLKTIYAACSDENHDFAHAESVAPAVIEGAGTADAEFSGVFLNGDASPAVDLQEQAAEVQDEELEEIPLEFLEGVSFEPEEISPAPVAEPAEYALELELDNPFADLTQSEDRAHDGLDTEEEELSLSFDDDDLGIDLSGLETLPDFGAESPADLSASAAPADVTAQIEEAGFYLTQGLFAEAKRICSDLLKDFPDCPEGKDLLRDIELRQSETEAAPVAGAADFLDFADEALDAIDFLESAIGQDEQRPAAAALSPSTKGVDEQIDSDDAESHYNLGIAYREMGLVNDAIGQFDQAVKDVRRRVDALTLKGICLVDKKDFAEAEVVFKLGLATPDLGESQKLSLFYELGLLYEEWGRPLDALDSFQSAADIDLFFRNVQEMIQQLRVRLGIQDADEVVPHSGKGGKDRVSYV